MGEFGFKRVGIIISFGRNDMDVLDIFGTVSKISPNEIAGKRNHFTRNSTAVDVENNSLRAKDVVTVMQGEYRDREGANNGIFTARTNYVRLAVEKIQSSSTANDQNGFSS